MISIIAAHDKGYLIGNDNKLPWRIPGELQYFKMITLGKTVVMGKNTFLSLPNGALPLRKNVVLTRDKTFEAEGVEVIHDLDAFLDAVQPFEEVVVIGGQQIYEQTIARAEKLYITLVHGKYKGDAYFPPYLEMFDEAAKIKVMTSPVPYEHIVYMKKQEV